MPDSPKILLDATVAQPPFSGVQYAVIAQAQAIRHFLPQAQAIGFWDGADYRPPNWAAMTTASRILWQQTALPHLLQHSEAAALHALAYTCPWRCPVPVILNVHDVIALESPELCSQRNAWHMRALMPHSIRQARVVIVSSHDTASRVRRLFGEKIRMEVVPLGVDAERFAVPSPRPAFLSFDGPYLLFVGNIEPKKDLPTLLRAYGICAERLGIPLVVAGRPAWKCAALVHDLQNWHGPGKIILAGRVADHDLPGLYQQAAAVVMPSIQEGFGLPILEAMAAGTPVVHSDCPALVETSGGAGLSFPRGNPDACAEAICRAIAEPAPLHDAGLVRSHTLSWLNWGKAATQIIFSILQGG